MSISGISSPIGSFVGHATEATKTLPAASDPASTDSSGVGISPSSSVVTLSNGQSSNVTSGSVTLSGMPLAVAWAPQLFVQADADHDNKLTGTEFANLMKRGGMTTAAAQTLFQSFDLSNDGTLSMNEFVQGVAAVQASGNTAFGKVIDSYTTSQDGNLNQQSMQNFLSAGQSEAEKYWALRR